MTYAVIGTGAVGGYYGARLAHSGQQVNFLLHKDYEYVREHGLQVDSCDGNFQLSFPYPAANGAEGNIYSNSTGMPQCDVVLVSLKTTNNHLLKTLLPPLLHRDTIVILIQNGIGVEADVQQMLPQAQLAAGLAFICSAKTEPGHVNHQCYGQISIAPYSCRDEKRVLDIVADFKAASVGARMVEYEEARWKKAVWNMPFNGMTVALNTQTDLLLKNAATRSLIRQQMMEVIGAAQHLGVHNIDETFADLMISNTDEMTPYSPSMKLDYDFHRPLELHYIYERPIAIARAAGYDMPRLTMLMQELRFMTEKNEP